DIPAMFELERQCPTAAHWAEEQYRGIFKAMGEGVLRHGFVIDGSDERVGGLGLEGAPLAGFLVARQSGTEWELENVVVAAVVRRRGLGTMLVHELFARVLRANGAAVFLEVRESNSAARLFCQ